MYVSKAWRLPRRWQMPSPWAVLTLQMPHPWDWQGRQMPHSRQGGRGLGTGGIDWCITRRQNDSLEQLQDNVTTRKGSPVHDVKRFFHCDEPEQQFESGEQRGGNNGCSSWSGDSCRYRDLTCSLRNPHLSLEDRCSIVLSGPAGRRRRKGGIRPFKDMAVEELRNEFVARDWKMKDWRKIYR